MGDRRRIQPGAGGEARYASGIWVSGDFSRRWKSALRGRTLTADDDRHGCGSPPAVISYAFWQREYAGGPDILGRMISLEASRLKSSASLRLVSRALTLDVNSTWPCHCARKRLYTANCP